MHFGVLWILMHLKMLTGQRLQMLNRQFGDSVLGILQTSIWLLILMNDTWWYG